MRRFFSCLIALFFFFFSFLCPVAYAVLPVAAEAGVAVAEIGAAILQGYAAWRQLHPDSPASSYPGFTGGTTIDDDGFSGTSGTIDDGFTGYSGKFGTSGDKSFNSFSDAYDDYVSDLPCGTSYNSAGKLIWSPGISNLYFHVNSSVDFNTNSSYGSSTIDDSYSVDCNDTRCSVYKYDSNGNSSRFTLGSPKCYVYWSSLAPVSGYYYLTSSLSSTFPNSNKKYFSSTSLYSSGDSISGCCENKSSSTGNSYGFVFYFYPPIYEVSPSDSSVQNIYNDNSRAWNLNGKLGITNISGDLTNISGDLTILDPDLKIVNEHDVNNNNNPTYTNPETGVTYDVTDWSYDYTDRSYTLTIDNSNVEEGDTIGDTVVVTYGDENITVQEDHITTEGDTVTHNTESYNVYYIIDAPEEQDPDDPGTDPVVDPGSDPGGSGSGCGSCLCTHIGQQIAAGAFSYVNSGSGDFYSYVNIANGGTTTNNTTYNYYNGSGLPEEEDPAEPSDPDAPHTHVYNSSVIQEPSCCDSGVRLYVCSCGDFFTESIDPLGHSFVSSSVDATCLEPGYYLRTCSRCGYEEYLNSTPALGHDWVGPDDSWVVLDPRFQTGGEPEPNSIYYHCSRCNLYYVVPSFDSPAPPVNYDPNPDSQSIWERFGSLVGSILGGAIHFVIALLEKAVEALSGLVSIITGLFSSVVELFSGFTSFLVVVFPFLPEEFTTILTLAFVLLLAAGIIRRFLR